MESSRILALSSLFFIIATPAFAENTSDFLFQGNGNIGLVEQLGTLNQVTGEVYGNDNRFTVSQAGDNNKAEVLLGYDNEDGLDVTHANNVKVEQAGNRNTAITNIASDGESRVVAAGNHVTTIQEGDSNTANISTGGIQNTISVSQTGTGNSGKVTNYGRFSTLSIDTLGNNNKADIFLVSLDDQAAIVQTGNRNTANIGSVNGGRTTTFIGQTGEDNLASIRMYGQDIDTSILQNGLQNKANVLQDGDHQTAHIDMRGNGNQLTLQQQIPWY